MSNFDDGDETPDDVGSAGPGQGLVESGTDAEGKHIIIGIQDWWGSADTPPVLVGTPMNAYLRMGAASPLAGTTSYDRGEDLASLVQGFADDTRDRGNGTENPPAPALASPSTDQRRSASRLLHTTGGWRDHSDGNRITTTRGDKIEVIQGNYKLVVLGRQSPAAVSTAANTVAAAASGDPKLQGDLSAADAARATLLNNAGGLDFSGGLNDLGGDAAFASDPDPDPPVAADPDESRHQEDLSVDYRWTQDSHGTWSWTMTTTIGLPSVTGAGKYRIVNNTFVDYQEDQFGYYNDGGMTSGVMDSRLSKLVSRTWATSMNTMVNVNGENHTELSGGMVENDTSVMSVFNHTLAVITTQVDLAGVIGLAQVGLIASVQGPGIVANAFVGPVFDVKLVHFDFHLGPHMDAHMGMHLDTRMGVHADTHIAIHTELHMGTHFDIDSGEHIKAIVDGELIQVQVAPAATTADTPSGHAELNGTPKERVVLGDDVQIAGRHAIGT